MNTIVPGLDLLLIGGSGGLPVYRFLLLLFVRLVAMC
jgi:hypothetical protein